MASGWKFAYYDDGAGRRPAKEFSEDLKRRDRELWKQVLSKIRFFQDRAGFAMARDTGLLVPMRGANGIFELKIRGTGVRYYCFTWTDPKTGDQYLIAATAEDKDFGDPSKDKIKAAEDAKQDWIARYGG